MNLNIFKAINDFMTKIINYSNELINLEKFLIDFHNKI